ncbi:MAG TPA: hypothetical protein V6D47_03235 [Oscillatoriaceae cyanobacterium]
MLKTLVFVTLSAALLLASCATSVDNPFHLEEAPSPVAGQYVADINNCPAPPPGQGVQLTVGPFNVPRMTESQKNFYMKLPVDHDVMVDRIQIFHPQGSHHVSFFKCDHLDVPDHVEDTFDAIAYQDYSLVTGSQSGDIDWKLPDGVGEPFKAHEQLLIQTHFVNAITQVVPNGQAWCKINLWFAPSSANTTTLGSYFGINPNLNIPPGSTAACSKDVVLSNFGVNQDVKIIAMTGHFHSRGRTFTVNRLNADGSLGEEIYRSDDWNEPPFKMYDPPIILHKGENLRYTSTFVNNTNITIGFGPHSETQEHSNLFMYFTPGPANGQPVNDVYASGTTQALQ